MLKSGLPVLGRTYFAYKYRTTDTIHIYIYIYIYVSIYLSIYLLYLIYKRVKHNAVVLLALLNDKYRIFRRNDRHYASKCAPTLLYNCHPYNETGDTSSRKRIRNEEEEKEEEGQEEEQEGEEQKYNSG